MISSDREARDSREVQSDTVSEEALILLERLVVSPEVMNAKQAAEFLGMTYNAFRLEVYEDGEWCDWQSEDGGTLEELEERIGL